MALDFFLIRDPLLLTIGNLFEQLFVDPSTVRAKREVVIHISQKARLALLGRIGVHCVLVRDSVIFLQPVWALVEGYPGFSHEHVLDTAHLHTACLSPVQEKYAGVWEGVKLRKQVFALDTVAICVCVVSSRVTLRRGQVHENLIVTKKIGSVKLEVLVSVFGLQR